MTDTIDLAAIKVAVAQGDDIRDYAPDLLAEVERLRAEVEELKAELGQPKTNLWGKLTNERRHREQAQVQCATATAHRDTLAEALEGIRNAGECIHCNAQATAWAALAKCKGGDTND